MVSTRPLELLELRIARHHDGSELPGRGRSKAVGKGDGMTYFQLGRALDQRPEMGDLAAAAAPVSAARTHRR